MAKMAFLVGSDYIGTPNELPGCAKDVTDISELLAKGNFSTTILTDAKDLSYSNGAPVQVAGLPTKANIVSNLTKMISAAKAGDTLIFYYSGHGTQIPKSTDGSEEDYIVPLDAVTGDFDVNKLISSVELHKLLIQVPQGVKLLMVADSCFSGNITEFDVTTKAFKPVQTTPFQHLKALIDAHTTRSESAHGALTLIAGCKSTQESTDLGSNGALTAAIKEWIGEFSLNKFLSVCWDYTTNALSQLKAALTATIEGDGVTDQDPQISYDKDNGILAPTQALAQKTVQSLAPSPIYLGAFQMFYDHLNDLYQHQNPQVQVPSKQIADRKSANKLNTNDPLFSQKTFVPRSKLPKAPDLATKVKEEVLRSDEIKVKRRQKQSSSSN